jgi:hypothetical protein
MYVMMELSKTKEIVDMTSLYEAVDKGNIGEVKQAIENGALLDDPESNVQPLFRAVANATDLKSRPDSDERKTALKIVETLLDAGANIKDPNNGNLMHPICYAAQGADVGLLKVLLEKGGDVNVAGKEGRIPLCFAARDTDTEVVQFLLDNGADINKPDMQGRSPLMIVANFGGEKMIEFLVNKGADVLAKSNNGDAVYYLNNRAEHYSISKDERKAIEGFLNTEIEEAQKKPAANTAISPELAAQAASLRPGSVPGFPGFDEASLPLTKVLKRPPPQKGGVVGTHRTSRA